MLTRLLQSQLILPTLLSPGWWKSCCIFHVILEHYQHSGYDSGPVCLNSTVQPSLGVTTSLRQIIHFSLRSHKPILDFAVSSWLLYLSFSPPSSNNLFSFIRFWRVGKCQGGNRKLHPSQAHHFQILIHVILKV